MNKLEIYSDLIKCGFIRNPQTNKWTPKENKFALPNTHAQYINYNSEYQYSGIKKLK